MRLFFLAFVGGLFIESFSLLLAAPCCSAGAAAPAMITGDDKAQVDVDFSGTSVIGDVPAHGPAVFRNSENNEDEGGVNLSAAHLISDRFQMGAALPIRFRAHEQGGTESEAKGVGDFRLNVAYELLPEWGYSFWRPKTYIFIQQVFPTGRSIYDSNDPLVADAFGKGFFATSSGFLFLKTWKYFDASWMTSAQYSYARTFDGLTVKPGWGLQSSLGIGLSPERGPVRLGFRIGPNYQQPKRTTSSTGETQSPYQLVWDTGFDIGLTTSRTSTLTASYTDQTLMGPAKNTTLARTLALNFQYRWER